MSYNFPVLAPPTEETRYLDALKFENKQVFEHERYLARHTVAEMHEEVSQLIRAMSVQVRTEVLSSRVGETTVSETRYFPLKGTKTVESNVPASWWQHWKNEHPRLTYWLPVLPVCYTTEYHEAEFNDSVSVTMTVDVQKAYVFPDASVEFPPELGPHYPYITRTTDWRVE